MPPRSGGLILISTRIDSLTSVHRVLVVVYNAPRCTMGKQGVSKGLRERGGGREGGGIYVATNSLRFAGVTYCLGARGHRIYSRRVVYAMVT